MLEDDVMVATKRKVVSTFDGRGGNGGRDDSAGKGKGKRCKRNRDVGQERSDGVSVP